MRNQSDWRSPAAQQEFAGFDYADCAQEFVRRSPDYRRDYDLVKTRIAAGGLNEGHELEVLARRWGMIFPVCPRRDGNRRARTLGTSRVADDCNTRKRTTEFCRHEGDRHSSTWRNRRKP